MDLDFPVRGREFRVYGLGFRVELQRAQGFGCEADQRIVVQGLPFASLAPGWQRALKLGSPPPPYRRSNPDWT
jgi:hypothetical protein